MSHLSRIQLIIAIILFIFLLDILHIGCPIKYITGISCAGCGMTRAWISVLHLDFVTAFTYHPLFFLGPVIPFLYLFQDQIPHKPRICIWVLLLTTFFAVYLLRLFVFTNDIVTADLSNSILIKFIRRFFSC